MKLNLASKYDGLLARFYDADHCWRDYKKQASLICSLYPVRSCTMKRGSEIKGFTNSSQSQNTSNGVYSQSERRKIRILDIGCGTGSHALELAKNGFQVVGIDRSSAFLKIAQEKTKKFRKQVHLIERNIFTHSPLLRGVPRGRGEFKFDCALFLGWSLNIAPLYERFSELLERSSPLLKPGGFFIFDAAIGPVTQKITGRSLNYKISQTLHGSLKIQEEVELNKSCRHLTYDWEITPPPAFSAKSGNAVPASVLKRTKSGGGVTKNYRAKPAHEVILRSKIAKRKICIHAEEQLVILHPEMLYETIKQHSAYFETVKILKDYNLDAPYQGENNNFIAVLRRKE